MSRQMGRVPLLAALLVLGVFTCALAKGAFVVTKQTLKEESKTTRMFFSYTYPVIRLPGALMGAAGNCRDFNAAMQKRAQTDLAGFRAKAAQTPPRKGVPGRNEKTVACHVMVNTATLVGLRFEVLEGWIGAAHPVNSVFTLNWMADGTWLKLDAMFKPGSAYLQALSKACTAELRARGKARGFDVMTDGLAPKAGNFARFIPQASGIQVFFDQGQATTSAAGVQNVIVPWSAVADMLSPRGKDLQKSL